MGIIDDYLVPDTTDKSVTPEKSSGLIQQYLDTKPEVTPVNKNNRTVPSPPISPDPTINYSTPEEAEAQRYKGGPSTPSFPSLKDAISDKFMSGVNTMGEGVGDVLKNQPATGAGKIGMGALGAVTSIPTGIGEFTDQVIGKPNDGSASFGDRAALLGVGAAPVAGLVKAAEYSPIKGPISYTKDLLKNGNLSPIKKPEAPKNEAFRKLVEDIGPENVGNVAKEMRANPDLAPADLSPSVQLGTQKLYSNVEGPHVNYIAKTSADRMAANKGNVEAAYDTATGLPVNAVNKLKELADASEKVGSEQINPAVAGASPVNLKPVIDHIDAQLKPGVNSVLSGDSSLPFTAVKEQLADVKKWLANKDEMRTGAPDLHKIQSAFRVEADNLLKSTDGPSRALGRSLMDVRNKIVDAIDAASPKAKATEDEVLKAHGFSDADIKNLPDGPLKTKTVETLNKAYGETLSERGTYAPALAKYRGEKEISEAFTDGYDGVLTNSKKMENRPEFTQKWVDSLTAHEKAAALEGLRTKVDTEVNIARNPSLAGTNLMKSDFNKQKMEMLAGKEETEALLNKLEAVRKITNTNNKLLEGSQTQMRNAQNSYFEPYDPKKAPSSPLSTAVNVGLPIAGEVGMQAMTGQMGVGALATGVALGAYKGLSAGASAAKTAIIKKLEAERNMSYSKMALPTEGPDREALIQSLEAVANAPPKLTNRSKLRMLVGP